MGPGFESPEVHQPAKAGLTTRGSEVESPKFTPDGIIGMNSKQGKQTNESWYRVQTKGHNTSESVFLTQWVHPFPFRTRKLSAAVVKILGWRRPGKIAQR